MITTVTDYKEIIETISDVFFALDHDLRYTFWNSSAEQLTGIKAAEAVGRYFHELHPKAVNTDIEKGFQKTLRTQKPQCFEYEFTSSENIKSQYQFRTYPSSSGLSVLMVDITERKKLLNFQHHVLSQVNDAIVGINNDQVITFWNDRATLLYGFTAEEAIGMKLEKVYKLKWYNPADNLRAARNLAREGTARVECIHHLVSGKEITVDANIRVIYNQDERTGLVAVIRDMTERKLAEKKLKVLNSDLETFLYKSSHNLKGPTASIFGITSVAKLEVSDENALKYFRLIEESVVRLNSTLDELLSISKIKQGAVNYSPIDFNELVKEVLKGLEYMPGRRETEIQVSIDTFSGFLSDRTYLFSVIQNLIENAIKYRNPKVSSFVNVSIKTLSGKIKIEVFDNGIGIPEGYKEKIFQMYFRANSDSKGAGLGLYLVKKAIEKLSGEITVESRENYGSRFTITLPIKNLETE